MALVVYLFIGVITVAIYMDLLWTTFPALTDFLPKEQIEVADLAKTGKHACLFHKFRAHRVQGANSDV